MKGHSAPVCATMLDLEAGPTSAVLQTGYLLGSSNAAGYVAVVMGWWGGVGWNPPGIVVCDAQEVCAAEQAAMYCSSS